MDTPGFSRHLLFRGLTLLTLIGSGSLRPVWAASPLVAWGDLGQSTLPASPSVITIGSGHFHDLWLTASGSLNAAPSRTSDPASQIPSGLKAARMAGGLADDLALRFDGTVAAWGDGTYGQTNVPVGLSKVVGIAAGTNDSLAVTRDGRVVAWGADLSGQPLSVPPDLTNIVRVASASSYFLALRNSSVLVWQPGSTSSVQVASNYDLVLIVDISAKDGHDLALRREGYVASWSDPAGVQLQLTFYAFTSSPTVTATAAGGSNVALITAGTPILTSSTRVGAPVRDAAGFSVSVPSQSGKVNCLEYKERLTDNRWTPLPLVAGTGGKSSLRIHPSPMRGGSTGCGDGERPSRTQSPQPLIRAKRR